MQGAIKGSVNMEYRIYKFSFKTAVHFGKGNISTSSNHIFADTFFSAMCVELEKAGCTKDIEKLARAVEENRIRMSDGFPFVGETFYFPKPMIKLPEKNKDDSLTKKNLKKLEYIPREKIKEYLEGNIDAAEERQKLSELGSFEVRTMTKMKKANETRPFFIETYNFNKNCGIYIIVSYKTEEDIELVEKGIKNLSYTGIGGKYASGLGKFAFETLALPDTIEKRLRNAKKANRLMSLSVCLPEKEKMAEAINGSGYILLKRSGFIRSDSYGDNPVKKRDTYFFAAGSCFEKPFEGRLENVGGSGSHPVYRYAKTMFLEVE